MRKLASLLIIFILLFVSVSASAVLDDTDSLKESRAELEKAAEEFYNDHEIGIYMATVRYSSGDIDYDADVYYHKNGFGKGEEKSGIMLYVATFDREYCIYAYGKAMDIFKPNAFDYVEDNVVKYLSETDFNGAFKEFYLSSEHIVSLYEAGTPYKAPFNYVLWAVIAVIVGGIAGIIYVSSLKKSMNTVHFNHRATRYAEGMNVSVLRDMFLFRTVTRVRKPQNNSSGGSRSSVGGGSFSSRSGKF